LLTLGTDLTASLPVLEIVLSGIDDGVAIVDAAGSALYCNPGARRILGREGVAEPPDLRTLGGELFYLNDFEPVPEEERPLVRARRGETSKSLEFFVRNAWLPDGALIRVDAQPLRAPDGRVVGALAVFRDVGARKRAEEELQAANAKLGGWVAELERRATATLLANEMSDLLQSCQTMKEFHQVVGSFCGRIFEHQPGAMFVVNASRSALELVASWGGGAPAERVFPPDACWALRRGRPHKAGGESPSPDCDHAPSDGTPGYVCVPMTGQGEALGILHVRRHPDDLGVASELSAAIVEARTRTSLAVAEDIALALANLKLRESLRVQAIRDPLTGLFNRRYMEASLEREIARAARAGSAVTAVMIDIDHFKRFNDTFGHAAADVALRETANTILANLRAEDIVCRFGGEELVLILPDTQLASGAAHADRIRLAVAGQQLSYQGTPLGAITASFGVAACPGHGRSGDALLRAADEALYQAKAEGRNRTVICGGSARPTRAAPLDGGSGSREEAPRGPTPPPVERPESDCKGAGEDVSPPAVRLVLGGRS
jgi:diguanylate cyclase (GGDEF)-like protein